MEKLVSVYIFKECSLLPPSSRLPGFGGGILGCWLPRTRLALLRLSRAAWVVSTPGLFFPVAHLQHNWIYGSAGAQEEKGERGGRRERGGAERSLCKYYIERKRREEEAVKRKCRQRRLVVTIAVAAAC